MCFSTQLNRLLWSNISLSPPLNLWFAWSTSFKLIQLSQGNNALDSPDSNTDDVLSRDTCVPLVCRSIFLFGAKGGYLHLESCDWLEIFLSTLNKLSQGNNTLDASAANIEWFHWRDTCVSSTLLNRLILAKKNEPFSSLKCMFCRKYSCHKLPELTGNHVLDAAASNTHGFLWRDTCVYPLRWIGLFGAKGAHLHLESPKIQEVFLSKTKAVLTGKTCTGCSCF